MNARDVMTSPVTTVLPTTPVPEIARLFLERRISGVPVVDQGKAIGVVSKADLLRLHEADGVTELRHWWRRLAHAGFLSQLHARLKGLCAADVMTPGIVSVSEHTPLADIAALLVERQVHRVTVVSGAGLVGIITGTDVMQALLRLTQFTSEDLRADADIEARLAAKLEAQAWWDPLSSHVSVDKGIVWFRGTVGSQAARNASRLAAQSTRGVCAVLDDRICAAAAREPWSSAEVLEYVSGD